MELRRGRREGSKDGLKDQVKAKKRSSKGEWEGFEVFRPHFSCKISPIRRPSQFRRSYTNYMTTKWIVFRDDNIKPEKPGLINLWFTQTNDKLHEFSYLTISAHF